VNPDDVGTSNGENKVLDEELSESLSVDGLQNLIGHTPLLQLKRSIRPGLAKVFIKMESFLPSGTIRDRYLSETMERARLAGQLQENDCVSIAGLNDSAVSAAFLAAKMGVSLRIFSPKGSGERLYPRVLHYGAEVVWTTSEDGLSGAVKAASEWARKSFDRMYIDSYRRKAVKGAYRSIANEILEALDGQPLSGFVTSVTTGATFVEVSKLLKEHHPNLIVKGVTLAENDYVSCTLDEIDIMAIEDTWSYRDEIARKEGIILGPKGAACVAIAVDLQNKVPKDSAIVALNPDSGRTYIGWEKTRLFQHKFLVSDLNPPTS